MVADIQSSPSSSNDNNMDNNSQDYIKNELTFDTEKDFISENETVSKNDDQSNDAKEDSEWMDVLGNGQLKKKVITKGTNEKIKPNQGDFCTIKYVGRLKDGKVIDDIEETVVQLGDHEVVQSIDLALALMNVGEVAEIETVARFAYGDLGRDPDIPPGAKITYEIELKKIEMEPEVENMDFEQRLKLGDKKREMGNWWFSRDEPTIAIQCYRRSLTYLVPPSSANNDEKQSSTEKDLDKELEILMQNKTKVYNNLAAAQLKTEAYDAALESVDNVLRVEPENLKALFRKGRIFHKKGEYTDAITTLLQAAKLDPDSKAISHELSLLREKSARNSVYERNLYRKMLGTTNNSEKKTSSTSNKNSTSFTQKYTSLLFSSNQKQSRKLAIWGLIGGTLATVLVYWFTTV